MKKWIFGLMIGAAVSGSSWAAWPAGIHGFVESAAGARISRGAGARHADLSLLEARLQLRTRYFFEEGYLAQKSGVLDVKVEGLIDGYFGGKASAAIREFNLALTPWSLVDLKAGRQVLTWGTGDYLFINDMFPKDYIAFFSGRDDEYLKKPSDAVRASLYFEPVNLDAVLIPWFEPGTAADGDRLTFYDPFQGGIAGEASERFLAEPSRKAGNMEFALRAFRTVGSYELAAYFFRGFQKMPLGYQDEAARRLFYPRVNVYGASLRGPFFGGIGNLETGYIDSAQDRRGDNRLIENSMWKMMAGYARDLGHDFSIGLQYLLEQRLDYGAYTDSLMSTDLRLDRYRHLVTHRVSRSFRNQTVLWSLFNFYSPSDKDGYLRASVVWQATDELALTLGANLPWGEDDFTEFGQMARNRNVFFRVRYSF